MNANKGFVVLPGATAVRQLDENIAIKDDKSSSSGAMFDYENSDSEASKESVDTPQSGKYSQDEEFTDPEDPVTVVKTALHIDTVTEQEELQRKIKEREAEEETKVKFALDLVSDVQLNEDEVILNKYRAGMQELKERRKEEISDPEIGDNEEENEGEEIDADLICKTMKKKRKTKSVKKELESELIQLNKGQVKEPDFIYDGENTLIRIGSERY